MNGNINKKEFTIDKKIVLDYISATIKIAIRGNIYFLSKNPFNKINKKDLKDLIDFLIIKN